MSKLSKQQVISRYITSQINANDSACAYAPSNIALCKYWGKRDNELNLPVNSSLSISLGNHGTQTSLQRAETDSISLNSQPLLLQEPFAQKVFDFIDLFRGENSDVFLDVNTVNTIPTAAGLASSASGFAALMLAIDDLFQFQLSPSVLSAFARMGSGSASRSLYHGFVEWQMGQQDDGMDSFAYCLDYDWQDICIGLVKVSTATKNINSRDGMNQTVATSQLYQSWPQQAQKDIKSIHTALATKNFTLLGQTAEHNALSMHATMISSWPPVLYWHKDSIAAMHKVWELRASGIEVYFTMDAGPNLKLLFQKQDESVVSKTFDSLDVIHPFNYT